MSRTLRPCRPPAPDPHSTGVGHLTRRSKRWQWPARLADIRETVVSTRQQVPDEAFRLMDVLTTVDGEQLKQKSSQVTRCLSRGELGAEGHRQIDIRPGLRVDQAQGD